MKTIKEKIIQALEDTETPQTIYQLGARLGDKLPRVCDELDKLIIEKRVEWREGENGLPGSATLSKSPGQ